MDEKTTYSIKKKKKNISYCLIYKPLKIQDSFLNQIAWSFKILDTFFFLFPHVYSFPRN